MTQTLVWKEWREQRAVFAAALSLSMLLPVLIGLFVLTVDGELYVDAIVEVTPPLCLMLLWPIFASLFGAGTFANERAERTLDFLVSRPVSRVHLWAIKVATAALSLLAVIGASLILIFVLSRGDSSWIFGRWMSVWPMAPATGMLFFAAAVLMSSTSRQSLAAAAKGALVTLVVMLAAPYVVSSMSFYYWSAANLLNGTNHSAFRSSSGSATALQISLAAALLLLASLWRFAGDELRGGQARKLKAGMVTGVAVLTLLVAITPYAALQWGLSLPWAGLQGARLSPDGITLAFNGTSWSREQSQVWLASSEGGEIFRLSPRLRAAFDPEFSPDGRFVAYVANRSGAFLQNSAEIWVAARDGSESYLVATLRRPGRRTSQRPVLRFSEDGGVIAVLWDGTLSMAPLRGGGVVDVDVRALFSSMRVIRLLGWSESGEVLVGGRNLYGDLLLRVAAFDPGTGAQRDVLESRAGLSLVSGWGGVVPQGPIRYLPVYGDGNYREAGDGRLTIVDVESGVAREITDQACLTNAVVSSAENALYYFRCVANEDVGVTAFFHRRDLDSGTDEQLAEINGEIRALVHDRRTGQFIVRVIRPSAVGPDGIYALDRAGTVRIVTQGNIVPYPLGAAPDGRIILSSNGGRAPFAIEQPGARFAGELEFYQ